MAGTGTVSLPLAEHAPAVTVTIGTCSPVEMLDRVRKTQIYILSEVSKQVEDELKGFKMSVMNLNANMDDHSPVAGLERWKQSMKSCLTRCQYTLANLERWLKREMNSWRSIFARVENLIDGPDDALCRACQIEEIRRSFARIGGEESEKEKEAGVSAPLAIDSQAYDDSQTCQQHHWVVVSVDLLPPPEFDADMSEDPREFLSNLEKYFKRQGWKEKVWLSQVENHMKGAAQKWWEYRHETIKTWQDFQVAFLQYCERLLVRHATQRDLDLPQRRWESLEQFVWRKRSLYHRLYVDANEEDMIQYIIGTLHPEIRRYLKPPLPKTMEELVQRGTEVQLDFDLSDEQALEEPPAESEPVDSADDPSVIVNPYSDNKIYLS
ncbi:activity-regulated cytoskeleton-associated protein [Ambystoma mexicanum]|uniref:activity-regulated cytoskeleton-associated protein n=1 Tax=Ambystoma mexicanum TaxID=8296 RepID=UPI0037E86412